MAKNLLETFVHSAVRQAGRDTGKVISNEIWGDKHSTPFRRVNSVGKEEIFYKVKQEHEEIELSAKEFRELKINEGWEISYTTFANSAWFWFLRILLLSVLFFIPFLGGAIILIMAIVKFTKKNIFLSKLEETAIYNQDGRYRGGARFDGYSMQNIELKIPANENDKKILQNYGTAYLIIFFVHIIFWIYIYSIM